jgi:hypothetical protein
MALATASVRLRTPNLRQASAMYSSTVRCEIPSAWAIPMDVFPCAARRRQASCLGLGSGAGFLEACASPSGDTCRPFLLGVSATRPLVVSTSENLVVWAWAPEEESGGENRQGAAGAEEQAKTAPFGDLVEAGCIKSLGGYRSPSWRALSFKRHCTGGVRRRPV